MDEIDTINHHLGLRASIAYSIVWTYNLFSAFIGYKILFDDDFEFNKSTIFIILWCLYLNFYIASMMYGCTMMQSERCQMLKLLRMLIKKEKNQLELAKLLAFCNQVQKRQVVLTSGLFDFDWKFVFSVSCLLLINTTTSHLTFISSLSGLF